MMPLLEGAGVLAAAEGKRLHPNPGPLRPDIDPLKGSLNIQEVGDG